MTSIDPRPERIALLTDFGSGPYVGQLRLVLSALAPGVPVVSLISDLVPWRPDLAAYMLPGLRRGMPPRTLYLCVVDPGVGSDRGVLAAQVGEDWLLGPDNGLLLPQLQRASGASLFRVDWRPERSSASFHGRDLFAPLAAQICRGVLPQAAPVAAAATIGAQWPEQRPVICYVDDFGNLITALDADALAPERRLTARRQRLRGVRTFSDVPVGTPFWYRNAFDLVEIAVNQDRADRVLGLAAGSSVGVESN